METILDDVVYKASEKHKKIYIFNKWAFNFWTLLIRDYPSNGSRVQSMCIKFMVIWILL